MIKIIKKPIELFILINTLNLILPPSIDKNNRLKKLIRKHIGPDFTDQQELAKKVLEPLIIEEILVLATESIKILEKENEDTKNKIFLLIEKIIFSGHEIFPAERMFYDLAKKHLFDKSLRISPSIELLEYLHVLSYASKSDFVSLKDIIHIWKKYMGPDVFYYYHDAQKNLLNLSLEDRLLKIGNNLQNMSSLCSEEKDKILLMVDEILCADNIITKQESVIYKILVDNLEVESTRDEYFKKQNIKRICTQIVLNQNFHHFINIFIIFSSVIVGIETNKKFIFEFEIEFQIINLVIQYIFVTEIIIRYLARWDNPKGFFFDSWNIFDLSLVVFSFLQFGPFAYVLRLLRLARLARILRDVHQLRIICLSLVHSVKPTGFVCLLLFLLIYVYGVIGHTIFSENDPIHFGTLAVSMSSLLQTSFEGWSDVLFIQMYGCKDYGYTSYGHLCNNPTSKPIISLIFFLSFIVINGLVIMNLIIGIIIHNMEMVKNKMSEEDDIENTMLNIENVLSKIRSKKFEKMFQKK